MRKGFISLLAVTSLILAGCGGQKTTTEGPKLPQPENDPKEISVQFVPSKNADAIMLVAPALEELLHKEIPDHTFKIAVGTDYAAVVEGMDSGQVHVGFLTSQQYAQTSLERPGKVQVLLTSVRNALYVQTLKTTQERIDFMNNQANNYRAEYITDYKKFKEDADWATETRHPWEHVYMAGVPTQVTAYQSMLLTTKEKYEGGLKTVKDLAGKKVCVGRHGSGAGYIYPSVLLADAGLKFTTGTPSAKDGTVQEVPAGGHTDCIVAMLRGDCDVSCSYHDARRDMYWVSPGKEAADSDGNHVIDDYENLFTDTRVVALSDSIYNDTISASTSISQDLRNRIQRAFMNVIQTEEGVKALGAYTHIGYKLATDSDYDGERKVYKFKLGLDK